MLHNRGFLRGHLLDEVLHRFHSGLSIAIGLWVVGCRHVVSYSPSFEKLHKVKADIFSLRR